MSSQVESVTLRKLSHRLAWFTGIVFYFSWIDRANLSIAALRMNQDLKFTATVYGLGAGLFFAGYAISQIPSNLILYRVGARRWIATIMIAWGIISACCALVQGQNSFYILRFLLGIVEAGLVPGVLYYLSTWFPADHRAKPFAIFLGFSMIALITMGPISAWLMGITNGMAGVAGWRWLFVFEGLPASILGIVTLFYLKDRPEEANWLTAEEKAWLHNALEESQRRDPPKQHASVGAFVSDRRLWALAITFFFWNFANLGIMFWLPLILKSMGNLTNTQVGLLYSLPFVFALIGLYYVGGHSDRTGERKYHIIVCALVAFVALAASTVVPPIWAYILICIACFHIWGLQPIFWTLPAGYMAGRSAAAGIALVGSFAGVGGFVGPWVVGWIRDATGRFTLAIFAMALAFLVMACCVMAMKIQRTTPAAQGKTAAAEGQ